MKVGIITFHRANNFGALLQAYALVSKIKELGHEGVIIDWHSPHIENAYHAPVRWRPNPISFLRPLCPKIPIRRHLWARWIQDRKTRICFDKFRKHLPLTAPCRSRKELIAHTQDIDCFIAGSDQIWNPKLSGEKIENFDRTFFLDFVNDNKKKNAYSASIGLKNIDASVVDEVARLIKQFHRITMREASGASFIEKLIEREIPVTLDPVFLQSKEFWTHLAESTANPWRDKKYIFVYPLVHSSFLWNQAKIFAQQHKCEIITCTKPETTLHVKAIHASHIGPLEMVQLIASAEAIFTNSFHGSAMSMLLEKRLFLEIDDIPRKPNTRFDSLFDLMELPREHAVAAREDSSTLFEFDTSQRTAFAKNLERERSLSLENLDRILVSP